MTESEWTRKMCKQMETMGAFVTALVGGRMQQSGLPDRLVIWKGVTIFIEFKSERGKLSALQSAIHRQMISRGGHVYVARMPGIVEGVGEFKTGQELLQLLIR